MALNRADAVIVGVPVIELFPIDGADIGLVVMVTLVVGAIANVPFGALGRPVPGVALLVVTIV